MNINYKKISFKIFQCHCLQSIFNKVEQAHWRNDENIYISDDPTIKLSTL